MKPLFVDQVLWVKRGKGIAAAGRIPEESEIFKDHFPGFPVLPGVLALEMLRETTQCYYEAVGEKEAFELKKVQNAKFSAYLKPGDSWESHLERVPESNGEKWNARLLHKGQVAVSARLTLVRKMGPTLKSIST